MDELDYVNFLIASQRVFTSFEAAKTVPHEVRQRDETGEDISFIRSSQS